MNEYIRRINVAKLKKVENAADIKTEQAEIEFLQKAADKGNKVAMKRIQQLYQKIE